MHWGVGQVEPLVAVLALCKRCHVWCLRVSGLVQALNQEEEVEEALLAAMESYALRDREGLYPVFGIALVTLLQVQDTHPHS